ncbi:GtrA family protein [Cesiribacter sp. SM1]|uniref:GtrA family protein n=1 Tax=Cesiribacter sp. SM1 TaxID=2861196 RepID=UPI001CD69BC4|nr:GtrA family protein [Cesiribacter sp. SM1]
MMVTLLKAQTASLVASGVDFLLTLLLVELIGGWYLLGAAAGTFLGGFTHFTMSRSWVYGARKNRATPQLLRYLLIWNGSMMLNITGVFILTDMLGFQYLISKVSTSLLVGFFYNYLFHKKYVFR